MARQLIESLTAEWEPGGVHRRIPRGAPQGRRGQDQRRGDRDRRARADGKGRRPDGGPQGERRGREEGGAAESPGGCARRPPANVDQEDGCPEEERRAQEVGAKKKAGRGAQEGRRRVTSAGRPPGTRPGRGRGRPRRDHGDVPRGRRRRTSVSPEARPATTSPRSSDLAVRRSRARHSFSLPTARRRGRRLRPGSKRTILEISIEVFVRVDPDRAGLGISSALLDWGEGRARDRLSLGSRTRLQTTAAGTDGAGIALLAREDGPRADVPAHAARPRRADHRRSARRRPLSDVRCGARRADVPPAVPRLLRGPFRLRAARSRDLRPDVGAGAGLAASLRWSFAGVEASRSDSWASSRVTEDPSSDGSATSGCSPSIEDGAWGRSLLRRAFSDLAASGCSTVRLNVDADNATGATRLYEKVGMTVRREWMVFEQPFVRD